MLPADDETCDDNIDADCDGAPGNGCVYGSCSGLPAGSPNGVYAIDPDGSGQASALGLYCDVKPDGTGWALLANSVGGPDTLAFWQKPYAERLAQRGTPNPATNYYFGALYSYGVEYRDELEDLAGAVAGAANVTVAGFDTATFTFLSPGLIAGSQNVFDAHFAAGWSASDFDGDVYSEGNCAANYAGVAQHYSSCWVLSFGADAELPLEDEQWGPHAHVDVLAGLGLAGDGSSYARVARYSRWVRW